MGLSSSPPRFPDYRHYSPPPSNCLCNAFYRHLSSRSATGAEINGTGPDGCLPELDMFPLLQVMCLWYMCFCAEVFFFSVLRLYSKWSIVWGLKLFFSSSLSSCKSCIFLNTLSPVLSTPLSYVCCVCMDRLMANFAGTCTSDNKGLLLLLLLLLLLQSEIGIGYKLVTCSHVMCILLHSNQGFNQRGSSKIKCI